MSGGHFNYAYQHINSLAQDLEHEIARNEDLESGSARYFSDETVAELWRAVEVFKLCVELGHAVEWLYSDDTSERYTVERVRELFDVYFARQHGAPNDDLL